MIRGSHPRMAIIAILIGAIVSTLCVAVLVGSIVIVGCIRRDIQQSMKDFRQRHLEATQVIEYAYAYFRDHGDWPSKADLERADQQWLSRGWEYNNDPTQEGPIMWLHGPNHMILSYRFTPPQQGAASNTWTLLEFPKKSGQ